MAPFDRAGIAACGKFPRRRSTSGLLPAPARFRLPPANCTSYWLSALGAERRLLHASPSTLNSARPAMSKAAPAAKSTAPAPESAARKNVDLAVSVITKQFGEGTIMRLGDAHKMKVETLSTGSLAIDLALGCGGLPRGRTSKFSAPSRPARPRSA